MDEIGPHCLAIKQNDQDLCCHNNVNIRIDLERNEMKRELKTMKLPCNVYWGIVKMNEMIMKKKNVIIKFIIPLTSNK